MAGVGLGGPAGPLLTLMTLLPWLVEEGEHPLSLCSTHHQSRSYTSVETRFGSQLRPTDLNAWRHYMATSQLVQKMSHVGKSVTETCDVSGTGT